MTDIDEKLMELDSGRYKGVKVTVKSLEDTEKDLIQLENFTQGVGKTFVFIYNRPVWMARLDRWLESL